jgi:hypothetical protein
MVYQAMVDSSDTFDCIHSNHRQPNRIGCDNSGCDDK